MRIPIYIVAVCCLYALPASAQKVADTAAAANVSGRALGFVDKKYKGLSDDVDRQTLKTLERMRRREEKLDSKVQKIDSTRAARLFAGTQARYQELEARLQSPAIPSVTNKIKQYVPGIDSMTTAMHFLSANNALPAAKLAQVQAIAAEAQQLQGRLQQANEAQDFIRQREQLLQSQLSGLDLNSQLLGMNKQVYYYQQTLQQYKQMANDPEKLGEAVLSKVQQMPAFQGYWQKYSLLSQLFPMPQNLGTVAALAGLQSRAQVQGIIAQRLPAAAGPDGDPSQFLQQQMQAAQSQLGTLKDKISQLTGGTGSGSSDMVMPDFTPNSQHTKTFLKRLTYGYNIQFNGPSAPVPAICAIGLTAGYRLSDKATIGAGVSYQLGMGTGFSHIAFSSQGVGLRSYADWKIPDMKGKGWQWLGGLWVTGGYEYNYLQAFAKLSDLQNISLWQKSALLGLTKKYKVGKHEGNIQLLYDFLANQETPRGQQFVYRVGYSF